MFPARYHALRNRVLAQVDHTFAEPVRLSFMKEGVVDPDRAMIDIDAILRVDGGKETSPAGSMVQSWESRISAQRGELLIDRAAHPGLVFRKGDKVRALARPGQPWFEVLTTDDRGATRLVVALGEA